MQANNIYVYCGNNPIVRIEIAGQFFDIVFDVISLGFSIADVVMNPTDALAWAGLAGDALDLIPGITGLGEVIKATNGAKKLVSVGGSADEVVDTLKVLNKAERTKKIKDGAVVMSYKNLKKLSKDTGLEAHHLIEKRFASALGIDNADDILSIAIDKDTHQLITSKIRDRIGYKNDISKALRTDTANAQDVWKATVKTYEELGMEEYLPQLKKQIIDIGKKSDQITDWMGY